MTEEPKNESSPKPLELPHIELPRVGRILSEFAHDIGEVLKNTTGVFLQEATPVVLEHGTDRLCELTPSCFRTFGEKFFITVKLVKMPWKKEDGSDAYEARPDSMNKMQAEACLTSHQCISQLKKLRRISRIPVPILRGGELTLQTAGYDAETKILVKEA